MYLVYDDRPLLLLGFDDFVLNFEISLVRIQVVDCVCIIPRVAKLVVRHRKLYVLHGLEAPAVRDMLLLDSKEVPLAPSHSLDEIDQESEELGAHESEDHVRRDGQDPDESSGERESIELMIFFFSGRELTSGSGYL